MNHQAIAKRMKAPMRAALLGGLGQTTKQTMRALSAIGLVCWRPKARAYLTPDGRVVAKILELGMDIAAE